MAAINVHTRLGLSRGGRNGAKSCSSLGFFGSAETVCETNRLQIGYERNGILDQRYGFPSQLCSVGLNVWVLNLGRRGLGNRSADPCAQFPDLADDTERSVY